MEQAEDGNDSESATKIHVRADLYNYGKGELLDGQLSIDTSAATYTDKGEDRYCVSFGNTEMRECQSDFGDDVPRMTAYIAVFDGHDGPRASEYCYRGLLPHILSETEDCFRKHDNHNPNGRLIKTLDGSRAESPLEAGIINAFHSAQARFAKKLDPPTFEDVKEGVKATRFDNKGPLVRMMRARPRKRPRGGTTALTLQIYGDCVEGAGNSESYRPMPCAVVANTGDCRLLTDNGTGSHTYHQVTTDHRPGDPNEHSRLVKCVRQGNAILGREVAVGGTLRVYPGGLAVSRSLGDLDASSAIICTPDIFHVPITGDGKTHRFVLGSDGLWDVMTNDEVGKIVARVQKTTATPVTDGEVQEDDDHANDDGNNMNEEKVVDPSEAAEKLMEECLKNGGQFDDVTLLVVDIRLNKESEKAS